MQYVLEAAVSSMCQRLQCVSEAAVCLRLQCAVFQRLQCVSEAAVYTALCTL